MRKVIALEFVGLKQFDCDLYDESGNIVYEKNSEFTPELLIKLNHMSVFKRDEEQTEKSNVTQSEKLRKIIPPEPLNLPEISEYRSKIDGKKVEMLLDAARDIVKSLYEGIPPKAMVCRDATQSILDEVYDKVDTVANICELRINDYYTYTHGLNVAVLSAIIGREMGFHENKVKDLTFAGLLHDLGKLVVPASILYKPGKLTPEEYNEIKTHPQKGFELITNEMGLPDYLAKGALEHHERWNGGGYPNGLKGDEISQFGQIIAIADVFDALVSEKIYRKSVLAVDAIRIMLNEESQSFNPEIFHKFAFLTVVKNVKIEV